MGDGVSVPLEFSERPWKQALELSLGARKWGVYSSGEGHSESISSWHLHLPQKGLRKLLQDVVSREMEEASLPRNWLQGPPGKVEGTRAGKAFWQGLLTRPNEPGPET